MDLMYKITRKKIKNMVLRIKNTGEIFISAPTYISEKRINEFIDSKRGWIERHIKRISEENSKKVVSIRDVYCDGEKLCIFGKILILKEKIELTMENPISLSYDDNFFYVGHKGLSQEELKKNIHNYLHNILNDCIVKNICEFEKKINVSIDYFIIKKLKSAWGIYHKRKNYISFNILLIEKPIESIEYVVLHELCHIVYQNHKKEFWDLVAKFMPNYLFYRKQLKNGIVL